MATRYLYGDSEPFPEQYDFLAALKAFVTCAARVMALQHQADELEKGLSDRAQSTLYTHEALQKFFAGMVDGITERAVRSAAPQAVGPYSNALINHVEKMAAEVRALHAKDVDDSSLKVTTAIRERRAEMREVLSAFLLTAPLPVLNWAVSLELAGAQPHGQAVLTHPGDVLTEHALDVLRDDRWSRPRRVGDFVSSVNVQVGFKKAFLRSSLTPEIVQLDELFVSGIELGPDSAELRLRRRMDHPRDSFVISVEPQEDGNDVVKVKRLDDDHASDAPYTSQAEDAMRIEALVGVVRTECESLLRHKRKLLAAQIDGRDVFEPGSMTALFSRMVDRLAPIAHEVARRSPNANELSLKVERPDGRREELYIRKKELAALATGLPFEASALFQRLALISSESSAGMVAGSTSTSPAPSTSTSTSPSASPSTAPSTSTPASTLPGPAVFANPIPKPVSMPPTASRSVPPSPQAPSPVASRPAPPPASQKEGVPAAIEVVPPKDQGPSPIEAIPVLRKGPPLPKLPKRRY